MFQDIKDEVLSGEPLYTIRDSSGNVLNDNVDISLKTPITQEGTPVNRALFRNLQGDLYTQDRYNEIEIAQNGSNFLANLSLPLASYEKGKIINVVFKRATTFYQKFSGNIIPLNWTATDTTYKTYTSGAGDKLTASGNSSTSNNTPEQAVDGDDSTYWSSDNNSAPYIIVNFAEPKKITKMNVKLLNSNPSRLISITISGSNDNSNFTELYKSTTTIDGTVTLNNTNYYKYYRIRYSQSPTPVNAYVYRIATSEYEKVKTEFDNLYININSLGEKKINGTIYYDKEYSLVYNGESFDIVGNTPPNVQKWELSSASTEFKITNINELINIGETFDIIAEIRTANSSAKLYLNAELFSMSVYSSNSGYLYMRCTLGKNNKLYIQNVDTVQRTPTMYYTTIDNFHEINQISVLTGNSNVLNVGTSIELIRR